MEGKYSLIFMADNGKTSRWRLSPGLLRVLLTVLLLLPLLTGGSLWLNWELYQDRRAVLADNAALRATVDANAQTVTRLSALETYLKQAAPEVLGSLVLTPALPAQGDSGALFSAEATVPDALADPLGKADVPSEASAKAEEVTSVGQAEILVKDLSGDPASPSPERSTEKSAEHPALLSEGTQPPPEKGQGLPENTQKGEIAQNAEGQKNMALPAAGTEEQPGATANNDPGHDTEEERSGDDVDTGLARVENLNVRRVGARTLRVSFDLFNTGQVPQLSGKATFELILKDGRVFPLAAHGDTTYRINRLKKIVGNPTLPADVTDTTDSSLRISIFEDNDLIYRVSVPVQ